MRHLTKKALGSLERLVAVCAPPSPKRNHGEHDHALGSSQLTWYQLSAREQTFLESRSKLRGRPKLSLKVVFHPVAAPSRSRASALPAA